MESIQQLRQEPGYRTLAGTGSPGEGPVKRDGISQFIAGLLPRTRQGNEVMDSTFDLLATGQCIQFSERTRNQRFIDRIVSFCRFHRYICRFYARQDER